MKRTTGIPWKRAGGFSLIEVTIALGIAAFCLVTVFALLPLGLSSNQQSFEDTVADNISTAIMADLRSVQTSGTSARYGLIIPSVTDAAVASGTTTTLYLTADGVPSANGDLVTSGTGFSRYRATVGFYFPTATQNAASVSSTLPPRTATTVRILITWPALSGSNYTGSYETDSALDCN
jgi:type II secretory pathway pseudopilin PulG